MAQDGAMTDAPPGNEAGDRDVARALASLPADARAYTARQQIAARRDLGARLGSYQEYRPEPFVGQ
jgi:hypothetical protein